MTEKNSDDPVSQKTGSTYGMSDADASTITVCPLCDSSQIRAYGSRSMCGAGDGTTYTCRDCGDRFDEPDRREAETYTQPKHGLAPQLAKPDAELATDGGADRGE